jgi:glutamine amidotransferase
MRYLRKRKLDQVIVNLKQPVLDICLGMQLMCRHSEENNTACLGIFDEEVKLFKSDAQHKVPHMGWNSLQLKNSWLDSSLANQFVYFVHSYYVPASTYSSALTDYTLPFSSAMKKDNFYAVQFHPEKSAAAGEKVLKSFLSSDRL